LDDKSKELLKYGVSFIALIAIFYGGTVVLRTVLGTSNPMMVVVSQSMVPTLGVGDFIFIEAIDDFDTVVVGEPPQGDILVFIRPRYSDEYIVHRAIEAYSTEDGWVYQTKGDNNKLPDAFKVPEDLVIGRVVNRIPVLGYFSLFIKTMKGFSIVLGLMAVSFFFDDILPNKPQDKTGARFNYIYLAPFLVAPLVLVKLWIAPSNHETLEFISLAAWYVGCILLPLTTSDDDMGLMFWLYHAVLLMIPIACDLVWWTMGITPSNWWRIRGSTLPVSWLLMKETAEFQRAFNQILFWIGPGIMVFLGLMYAKRSQVPFVLRLSRFLKNI